MTFKTIIDKLSEMCIMRIPHTIEDGEGGRVIVYERGHEFVATLSKVDPTKERKAEHDVPWTTYHLTVPLNGDEPVFGDVFEDSHGKTYRVVSEGVRYPHTMGVQYSRFDVERWDIPGDEVTP
jgi:hypothetical protein